MKAEFQLKLEKLIESQVKTVLKEQQDMFEKYDDTDLNGSGVEMALTQLIEEYTELIKKQIPKEDQNKVRQEIKKLWLYHIKNWVKL
jgi:valyl-tRNA synthetase